MDWQPSVPKPNLQSLIDSKICNECKNVMDYNAMFLCKGCADIFCFNCSNAHKHPCCPIIHDPSFLCHQHAMKFEFFCKEESCKIPICRSCAELHHKDHRVVNVTNEAFQLLKELSQLEKLNAEKIDELIHSVRRRKNIHDKEYKRIKDLLVSRRNFALKTVSEIFNEKNSTLSSMTSNTSNDLESIGKLEKLLTIINYTSRKYSPNELNLNILQDYEDICFAAEAANDLKDEDLDCKSLYIKPANFLYQDAKKEMELLIGKVERGNDLCFRLNSTEELLSSVVHDGKQEHVKDIQYDFDLNALVILKSKKSKCTLSVLYEDSMIEHFENGIRCKDGEKACLLLLQTGILVQTTTKFYFTEDKSIYKEFFLPFCKVKNVNFVCSSPCKYFIFVSCNNDVVYKYNIVTLENDTSSIKVPFPCIMMEVCEDLDYIAFVGERNGKICIFSFSMSCILHAFEAQNSLYRFAKFISNEVLIAYDENGFYEWLNLLEKKSIKNVYHTQTGIGRANSMAISSNSVFLVFQNTLDFFRIYKVDLEV